MFCDAQSDHFILQNRWYVRDDNAVPPVYVLQRISTHLPDFISSNDKDRGKARDQWWIDHDRMQDVLGKTAEKCLGAEKARNYLVSGIKAFFVQCTAV